MCCKPAPAAIAWWTSGPGEQHPCRRACCCCGHALCTRWHAPYSCCACRTACTAGKSSTRSWCWCAPSGKAASARWEPLAACCCRQAHLPSPAPHHTHARAHTRHGPGSQSRPHDVLMSTLPGRLPSAAGLPGQAARDVGGGQAAAVAAGHQGLGGRGGADPVQPRAGQPAEGVRPDGLAAPPKRGAVHGRVRLPARHDHGCVALRCALRVVGVVGAAAACRRRLAAGMRASGCRPCGACGDFSWPSSLLHTPCCFAIRV